MTEVKELKPKSFRIDEETAEKFKAISQELGNNQQQTLSKLIETYEFQKGKTVLSQKKSEIETFEKYVTVLTRMYMASLEDNQNVNETVQAEFEALLTSKDETIIELQNKVKQANENALKQQEIAKESREEVKILKDSIIEIEQENEKNQASKDAMISEKEKLIAALSNACDSYKKESEDLGKATLERNAIATKHMQLQQEYKALEGRYLELKSELDHAKLQHERELLQKEMEFAKRLQEIEENRKQEIDSYQKKYMELLEQLHQAAKAIPVEKPEEPKSEKVKKEKNKE